jgi:peptide/nickel transport system substrate-binding protein
LHEKTLRRIGATVVLATLVVAGITQTGASEQPSAPEIRETTTSTAGQSTIESTAPPPFTYRVGLLSGVTTDNFWAFYGERPSVWNSYVLGPTKPALYTVEPSSGSLQPELAADHVEPQQGEGDGWSVRVELTRELFWSDGSAVTAHDLAFTFDTVRRLELEGSWADSFPKTVADVRADGDDVLVVEFTERPKLAVWPHAVGLAPVMAQHVWGPALDEITAEELYALSGEDDVSGGPLVVTSVGEDLITSAKNPGYPFADPPDTVEYHVFADDAGATDALVAGEVDYVLTPGGLPADELAPLEESPDVELITSPGNGIRYLGFNLTRGPMSDRAFRRALALLLDRAAPDAGPQAWSLVPQANTQWHDRDVADTLSDPYRRPLAQRLADAIEALEKAGYEWETPPSMSDGELVAGSGLTIDGQPPQPLTILTPGDEYDPARPQYAEAISVTLGILGFDARPVETDFDTVVDLAFTPDDEGARHYDMYMLGWTLGNPALPDYYRALFAVEGPMNNTGYRSERFEEALKAYEGSFTQSQARKALWDMERILARDLPYLLLYNNQVAEAYRSDRIRFDEAPGLGGLQASLGGVWDVERTR